MKKTQLLARVVHWLLVALTVFYLLTGFGITQFRIVESLTFGVLTKNLSFWIHDALWLPFVVTLVLHIGLSIWLRRERLLKKRGE